MRKRIDISMSKRLKVTLPKNWSDETDPGNQVLTLAREESKSAGKLQIWLSTHEGTKEAPSTERELLEMAIKHVVMGNLGRLDQVSNGPCSCGQFGTAVFWSRKTPRSQIWFISKGLDLIKASYVCHAEPSLEEVQEAQVIVETVEVVEG